MAVLVDVEDFELRDPLLIFSSVSVRIADLRGCVVTVLTTQPSAWPAEGSRFSSRRVGIALDDGCDPLFTEGDGEGRA
ncbi:MULTISPECIES: hypothetical protein [unclassified Rhodococcus (in: high G+C Gram-positive bacteria)]|uniref:hypothetical protein n=1 Tax=unclassified Rhodococcus (in: high G+C Gram-positive bacteria) TaxID=192944 RepID=UPI0031400967